MRVNGKDFEVKEGTTVEELLEIVSVDKNKVVVELDGEIISKDYFAKIAIKNSNLIEVISFVGGG